MAENLTTPAAPSSRTTRAPWWKRALSAFGFTNGTTVEDQFRGVGWTDDAATVVKRVWSGTGLLDALGEAVELAPFYDAVDIEIGGVTPFSERAIRTAKLSVMGAGRNEVRCGDLLYALLRVDREVARELAEGGLTRAALTTWLAHGVIEHPPVIDAPEGETLEIVLHNDDFTPQEVVVELLKLVFGFDHDTAVERMLEVHSAGASIIASLARREAIAKANEVRSVMRERGYPLLVTLECFT